LTEKTGLFSGVLAAKQGFCAGKMKLFFAFFHIFMVFAFASRCGPATSGGRNPPKKIVPKNLR
jgi:hypothetical protein